MSVILWFQAGKIWSLSNPWHSHPSTSHIKCKMKHVIVKPTNSLFVLPTIFFFLILTEFPLGPFCLSSVRFRKKGKKRCWSQPGAGPQACNLSVILLWVEMTKRIIHSDIGNWVMRLWGFVLFLLVFPRFWNLIEFFLRVFRLLKCFCKNQTKCFPIVFVARKITQPLPHKSH